MNKVENKTVWNDSYNIEGITCLFKIPIYQQAKIK